MEYGLRRGWLGQSVAKEFQEDHCIRSPNRIFQVRCKGIIIKFLSLTHILIYITDSSEEKERNLIDFYYIAPLLVLFYSYASHSFKNTLCFSFEDVLKNYYAMERETKRTWIGVREDGEKKVRVSALNCVKGASSIHTILDSGCHDSRCLCHEFIVHFPVFFVIIIFVSSNVFFLALKKRIFWFLNCWRWARSTIV